MPSDALEGVTVVQLDIVTGMPAKAQSVHALSCRADDDHPVVPHAHAASRGGSSGAVFSGLQGSHLQAEGMPEGMPEGARPQATCTEGLEPPVTTWLSL